MIRRLLDLAERVERSRQAVVSDFLSPREQYLAQSVAGHEGIKIEFNGGYPEAERRRALLMPEWWPEDESDYRVTALVAQVAGTEVSHGQVLGSLMGIGIDRRKVGDICVTGDTVQVVVDQDIAEFLMTHWRAIGRQSIRPSLRPPKALVWTPPQYEWRSVTLASTRVDAVLAAVCHWSRAKAKEWVERGQVMLNFTELDKADVEMAEGDVLSVRGFGRVAIGEDEGQTQRGRMRLRIGVLRS
jgi:RNA-binding protein YlmH